MSGLENVTNAVHAAETRLDNAVVALNGLKATVKALQDRLDAQPDQDDELTALAVELNGHVGAFDAALTPAPPVPADPVDDNDGADS